MRAFSESHRRCGLCLMLAVQASALLACGGDRPAATAPSAPPARSVAAAADAGPTTLSRAQVNAAIARGLGAFLQNVSVDDEPVMKGGRFHGFRLKALNPSYATELVPGDVVTRINGLPIERPEQADEALRALAKASALEVSYERAGQARTMVIPIVDRTE